MEHPLEENLWPDHADILGMDEAGRGPICGPLVVAGVIFEAGYTNDNINDSKKLSEKKREVLFCQIQQDAKAYWIEFVFERQIDKENIYRATQNRMDWIAQQAQAQYVLTDAMPLNSCSNFEAVVKGDQKSIFHCGGKHFSKSESGSIYESTRSFLSPIWIGETQRLSNKGTFTSHWRIWSSRLL